MENVFEVWQQRGFIESVTSDALKKAMERPLTAYIGVDPTADSLHLGNLLGVIACCWLQKFGHTPVVLIGGGTAKIGDPSGKSLERPLLEFKKIARNAQAIEKQFRLLLGRFAGKAQPRFVDNDDWLSSWSCLDFLRTIGKAFRMGPMLGKESVRTRLRSEEGMSFTEFSYQIFQAYDFYHLFRKEHVTLQIGGSDQWGNITAGVELTRKLVRKTVFGLTHPLLTRSDGAKFGKSEQGAIWLDPEKTSPYQFYQYFMRVADADVVFLMQMLTFMECEEISSFAEALTRGDCAPYAPQRRLAEEVTRFVHGEEKLQEALRVTKTLAPGSQVALTVEALDEIASATPLVCLPFEAIVARSYTEIAAQTGLVTSKGEATRLVKNGGAYLNHQKVEDPTLQIVEEHLIGGKYVLFGAGKKKKILVRVVRS